MAWAWGKDLLGRGSKRLKGIGHVVRTRPHVAIVPVVITGLIMGLGIWGVMQGSDSYHTTARRDAQWHMNAAASAMQLTIQEVTFPIIQFADFIRQHNDNYTYIKDSFPVRAASWMSKVGIGAGMSKVGLDVQGAPGWFINAKPAGILALIYPPFDDVTGIMFKDLMKPGPWRPQMLDGILHNKLTVSTPTFDHGMWVTSFQLPIFIANVSRDETFGMPWTPYQCPDYCYINATNSKWWGHAGLTVDANVFISKEGPLSSLVEAGYKMQVWRPPVLGLNETAWKVVDNPNPLPEPEDVVRGPVQIADATWEVHIWKDTWDAPWTGGLIALVVVGGLLFGLLIFAVLLSWEEHRLLLHSILPEAAIKQMRSELRKTHEFNRAVLNLVEIDTPAQHMLSILDDVVNGETPVMARVIAVQQALQRSADVYRPTHQDLQTKIKDADNLDKEVKRALVNQLAADSIGDLSCRTTSYFVDAFSSESGILTTSTSSKVSLDATYDPRAVNPSFIKAVLDPELPLPDELQRVLASADNWQFDAFELEEASGGRPLAALGYHLMRQSGSMTFAKIDGPTLARFLHRIEDGYKTNPYHNSRHAADVLQSFHVLLNRGGLRLTCCDDVSMLGCYLAAIIHDYEHLGKSNDFLVNTSDKLAIRYSDRSPMESHHLAAAWSLMQVPEFNILARLSRITRDKIRKLTIDLVLATDMKQHFAIMGKFTTLKEMMGVGKETGAGKETTGTGNSERLSVIRPRGSIAEHDQLLALQMALKCADLGHLAAPLEVHLRWVSGLEQEFFLQGDVEREKGLPISPLCDRQKEGVTKSQVGFFDFVVLPVFTKFTEVFASSQPLLDSVLENYRYWKLACATASTKPE